MPNKGRTRTIVLVRYRKTMDRVAANVKYIGFRAREQAEEERGFFNEVLERGADYHKFLDEIEHHPALQHSSVVKSHSMILSLRESDYRALLEAGGNFKDLARDIVRDLEERKGMKLTWLGALHEKSGHPHVHLAIMSVGKDAADRNRRLYLDKDDVQWLREQLDKHLEKHVPEMQREVSHGLHTRTRRQRAGRQLAEGARRLSDLQKTSGDMIKERANRKRRKRRSKTRIQQQQQEPGRSV